MVYGRFGLFLFFLNGLIVFMIFTGSAIAYSQESSGLIHEAAALNGSNAITLQAISEEPLKEKSIKETESCDVKAIWIPGYWYWDRVRNNFYWVNGIWRIPPPDHYWVKGYWKRYESGWVWFKGFWSSVPEELIAYINKRPPDPIQDEIHTASNTNSIWIPGYWNYDFDKKDYVWVSGRWMQPDPARTYVTAHYVWRPQGYVFIPSYWDWPMERRYCGASVNSEQPILPPEDIPSARSTSNDLPPPPTYYTMPQYYHGPNTIPLYNVPSSSSPTYIREPRGYSEPVYYAPEPVYVYPSSSHHHGHGHSGGKKS